MKNACYGEKSESWLVVRAILGLNFSLDFTVEGRLLHIPSPTTPPKREIQK